MVQVHVPARVWGFESLLRHHQCRVRGSSRTLVYPVIIVCVFAVLAPCRANGQGSDGSTFLDCTVDVLFSSFSVGPTFTVRVESQGKSMPMVKITLESGSNEQRRQNETAIKAKTGPDGIARFSNTKPGKYSLTVDELAPPALAEVIVLTKPERPDNIVIDWPDPDYVVLNVGGRLVTAHWQGPFKDVRIELLSTRTGRKLGETKTDGDGHYDFPLPPEGQYVLRFNVPGKTEHHADLSIEVDTRQGKGELPLLILDHNSCGTTLVPANGFGK